VARELDDNKTVVVILPDTGTRYLSKIYNDDWMKEKGFILKGPS
jgi:cystathionine beta-synthase